MNDVNYVLLGRRIRILRKYRKLTQEQLDVYKRQKLGR